MKRPIKVAFSAGIIAVLIGVFLLVKYLPPKEQIPYTPPKDRIVHLSVKSADLVRMSFYRNDGEKMEFKKVKLADSENSEFAWTLTYPETRIDIQASKIKDIAFTMSNIESVELIDEEPKDLSIYGLSEPLAWATMELSNGTEFQMNIGAKTPTGVSHYMQKRDDPAVYTLRRYTVNKLYTEINDLRETSIPSINPEELQYLNIGGNRTIEVVPFGEDDQIVGAVAALHKMVKPFASPKPVNSEKFTELLEQLPASFLIDEYVDDFPTDLGKYGLSPPLFTFELRDTETQVKLLLGNDASEDTRYAKIPNSPHVFTVRKKETDFAQADAFDFVDKFLMIVNIEHISGFSITSSNGTFLSSIEREKNLSAQEGEKDAVIETFFINDIEIEEEPYRDFYQLVIGLLADVENPSPTAPTTPDVSIEYFFDKGAVATARLDLEDVSRDFYAAYRDGSTDFLVSKNQVNAIFASIEGFLR